MKGLRPNEVFGGRGDERKIFKTMDLTSFDAVKVVGEPFASSVRSHTRRAIINTEWFACKTLWIPGEDDRNLYHKEVEYLRKLRRAGNWHIAQLIAYQTDEVRNEGRLVLSPLAENTLRDYLFWSPTVGRKQTVMRWFGCLAGALSNIHQLNITHKNIKTSNILVHGDNIIITGLSLSSTFIEFGDRSGNSYLAPEVEGPRCLGHEQDVWSLHCCFIEMFSFISGFTTNEFREWCKSSPHHHFSFDRYHKKILDWLDHLKPQTTAKAHLALLDLLFNGFKENPKERPTAKSLFSQLRDMRMRKLIGECCASPLGSDAESKSVSSLSVTLSMDTEPLRNFIVSTRDCIASQLSVHYDSVHVCMNELLQGVHLGQVRSLRSCEKKFLFYIAPVRLSHNIQNLENNS